MKYAGVTYFSDVKLLVPPKIGLIQSFLLMEYHFIKSNQLKPKSPMNRTT